MNASLPRRPGPTQRLRVEEYADGTRRREDRVAVEEPLEVRLSAPGVGARSLGVLMRTPGHDFELAAGWLVNGGVISAAQIRSVAYCTDESLAREQEFNVVTVEVDALPGSLPTSRVVDSACGVCGTDVIAEVAGPPAADFTIDVSHLQALPGLLSDRQQHFGRTGGTHGAGLVDVAGNLVVVREDVGRHNALDKAIGHCHLSHSPVPPIAVLSGRVAFELMQKAIVSGISMVVAVGAPTSLAVDLARTSNRTLVGFTSDSRCVAYAGSERLTD